MNKLLGIAGAVVVLGGLAMLLLPVSHIPLLDANRQVLAETEAAGYCAGEVYVAARGMGDEASMKECLAGSGRDTTIDYTKVQPAFCAGIIAKGLAVSPSECMEIMQSRQLWPTANGSLTASWNKRFPFPGDILSANQPTTGDAGRTGDRVDNEREGNTR
jgi:hypothetical protein